MQLQSLHFLSNSQNTNIVFELSSNENFISGFATIAYLAFPSIHCLLIKCFTNVEVDLGGTHSSGRFDVELLPILADLHVWVGGCCHSHLPQHSVHT